jgi:hypothetical protein
MAFMRASRIATRGTDQRTDRTGDQICEFLFQSKDVGHAADVLRPLLDADDDDAAGYQDLQGIKALGGVSVLDRRIAVSPPD